MSFASVISNERRKNNETQSNGIGVFFLLFLLHLIKKKGNSDVKSVSLESKFLPKKKKKKISENID